MTIKKELLDILVCPEDKTPVSVAADTLIQELNKKIENGALTNRSGSTVTEAMESGLIREDQKILYPVRNDIPIMLVDEGIPLT